MNDANKSMEEPQQYGGRLRSGSGGGNGASSRSTRRDGNSSGDAVSTEMSTVSQSFLHYQQHRQPLPPPHHHQPQQQTSSTDFQQLLATKATIQEHHPSTTYPRHHVQLPPQYQAATTAAMEHEKKHIRYQPIQYQIEYEKQQFQHQNSKSHRSSVKRGNSNRNHKQAHPSSPPLPQPSDEIAVSLISPGSGPPPTIVTIGHTGGYGGGGGDGGTVATSSFSSSAICRVADEGGRGTLTGSEAVQPCGQEVKIRSRTPSVIIERGCADLVNGETLGADEGALGSEMDNSQCGGVGGAVGSSSKRSRSKHRPLFRRLFHYVRNTLTGQKKKGDQDECEVYELPPRYRPESVSSLCQITRFSEEEVKRLYRGFKAECPSGVVREDTFKIIYSQFFSTRANTGNYAHFVFNTLDHDNSGIINFEDFLQTLSILSRGTLEEKLTWTFALYDINGDGLITREEMTDIVSSIYDMADQRPSMSGTLVESEGPDSAAAVIVPGGGGAGIASNSLLSARFDGERIKQKVDQIFQKMDMNQDGVVTLDEFISCCRNDEVISNSMIVFDNIVL